MNVFIFSITVCDETRYYRNDLYDFNYLLETYFSCKQPFVQLGEGSEPLTIVDFAELQQRVGTISVEIFPDNDLVELFVENLSYCFKFPVKLSDLKVC